MQEFTPLQYLQIDIANLYGKDKLSWNDRLSWFEENQNNLLSLVNSADSPCQFYAAITNYPKVLNGELNHHPIALDATSSGTQILACLIGDRKAAEYCNVVDVGRRVDAYTELFNQLPQELRDNAGITRDMIKKAIMTSLYGSLVKPREIFGEYVDDFIDLMAKECPLIWELNRFLTDNWNPEVDIYGWTMPDNFHVDIKVYENQEVPFRYGDKEFSISTKVNKPSSFGRAYSANCAHSCDSLIVREIAALAMHNPDRIAKIKNLLAGETNQIQPTVSNLAITDYLIERYSETDFLSARILNYIDDVTFEFIPKDALQELIDLVPAKPFQVLCIHDSFKVLPNYGNDLRRLYNAQLAKIAKSSLLQHIIDSLPIPPVNIKKGDPDLWKDILNTEYALS